MNRFLKKELSTQAGYIICNIFLNIVLTLILMSLPLIEGVLVDVFVYSKKMNEFQFWILFMIILTIAQIIIRYFISKINFLKKEKFVLLLNQKILNFNFRRHTKQVLAYEPTYLHSRVLQDSAAVIEFYFKTVSDVINSLVVMIVASIVLYRVNGYILLSLLIFFPVYTFIYVMFKEKIFFAHKDVMEASNDCFSVRNNIYANYLEVKVRKRESEVKNRLNIKEDTLMTNIKTNFILNFTLSTIKIGANSFFQFSGFAVGGLAVLKGYITLGVFTFIIQYFSMILDTVEQFLNLGTSYQGYRASLIRLNEILEIEEEPNGEVQLESIDSIELINVNYKFHNKDYELYSEGVNCTLKPNTLYTILGENGVGKSTLFMLMTGIYKDKI